MKPADEMDRAAEAFSKFAKKYRAKGLHRSMWEDGMSVAYSKAADWCRRRARKLRLETAKRAMFRAGKAFAGGRRTRDAQ